MNHAEALEQISQAATEPVALRGVQEGSDPAWWSLRDHLATCEACAREYRAWLRLADAVAVAPRDDSPIERAPATLREATLALARSSGVERGTRTQPTPTAAPAPAPAPDEKRGVPASTTHTAARSRWWRGRWGWPTVAGLAAVLAIVALIGALASTGDLNRQLQTARAGRAELANVAATVDHLMQAQDHQVVVLDRADGTGAGGSVIWSPTVGTLVVLSQELPAPPAGMTYRCWVAHQGARRPVGEMHFEGDLAYWAGPLTQWGGAIQPGDQFGVSLVPVTGGSGGEPVLVGGV